MMLSTESQDMLAQRLRDLREKCKKAKEEEVIAIETEMNGYQISFKDILTPIKKSMDITGHVLRCKFALEISSLTPDLWLDEDQQALFLFDVMNMPAQLIKERLSTRLQEVPS